MLIIGNPRATMELHGCMDAWMHGCMGACKSCNHAVMQSSNHAIKVPRLHPETNENLHKRFAQHRGSPRRGVKFARRSVRNLRFWITVYLTTAPGRCDFPLISGPLPLPIHYRRNYQSEASFPGLWSRTPGIHDLITTFQSWRRILYKPQIKPFLPFPPAHLLKYQRVPNF